MTPPTDLELRLLQRLLHGELEDAEARMLEEQIRNDPYLALRYQKLRSIWEALDPPAESDLATADAAADLAPRVMAQIHSDRAERKTVTPSWGQLSTAFRAATLLAAAAGVAGGVLLTASRPVESPLEPFDAQPTLAASYLTAFEEALELLEKDADQPSAIPDEVRR